MSDWLSAFISATIFKNLQLLASLSLAHCASTHHHRVTEEAHDRGTNGEIHLLLYSRGQK